MRPVKGAPPAPGPTWAICVLADSPRASSLSHHDSRTWQGGHPGRVGDTQWEGGRGGVLSSLVLELSLRQISALFPLVGVARRADRIRVWAAGGSVCTMQASWDSITGERPVTGAFGEGQPPTPSWALSRSLLRVAGALTAHPGAHATGCVLLLQLQCGRTLRPAAHGQQTPAQPLCAQRRGPAGKESGVPATSSRPRGDWLGAGQPPT